MKRHHIIFLWTLLFSSIISACSTVPSVELEAFSYPNQIRVTWQFGVPPPKIISKPDQLLAIQKFINARSDGWRNDRITPYNTPAAVSRDPLIRIEFYSDGKIIGVFGVGKDFFIRRRSKSGIGAVSRKANQQEIEELSRLLELRSHERLTP